MRRLVLGILIASPLLLAGCDMLGIESAQQIAERREAEGKAVGGACRHAARSIEDCYAQNRRADKAAVFAGWREMNDYMRENKIEAMPPAPPKPAEGDTEVAAAGDAPADGKGDAKGDAQGEAKAKP
jgi:hypothetical protein